MITESREGKFKRAVANRQYDLTIILENVHDPHNIGAVLRTCDSVGINEVFVIVTDDRIDKRNYLSSSTSRGAVKWVDIHMFDDVSSCIEQVRAKYDLLLGTHLDSQAKDLYELDLTGRVALVFGNEHQGISDGLLSHLDGNFIIPQYGLVQSLNISVACAVSLYEAVRQRKEVCKIDIEYDDNNKVHRNHLDKFIAIHRRIKY